LDYDDQYNSTNSAVAGSWRSDFHVLAPAPNAPFAFAVERFAVARIQDSHSRSGF